MSNDISTMYTKDQNKKKKRGYLDVFYSFKC